MKRRNFLKNTALSGLALASAGLAVPYKINGLPKKENEAKEFPADDFVLNEMKYLH